MMKQKAVIISFCLFGAVTLLLASLPIASANPHHNHVGESSSDEDDDSLEKRSAPKWQAMEASWGRRKREAEAVEGHEDDIEDDTDDDTDDLDKRKANWQAMEGSWGKRAGKNWAAMETSWGKRSAGWQAMENSWGKRQRAGAWDKMSSSWGKK